MIRPLCRNCKWNRRAWLLAPFSGELDRCAFDPDPVSGRAVAWSELERKYEPPIGHCGRAGIHFEAKSAIWDRLTA